MSRLGRDYILTGEYIEKIFPANGIRYIAVNDGIDTMCDAYGNDMIPFRAVFNDMYAKDISKKVRCALDTKRRAGSFIGSSAPYGYIKDKNDTSKLVPDEKTKDVVLRIYKEFLDGRSMLSIAKGLTFDGIDTPSSRKNDNRRKSKAWNSVMIKRILTNPTYKGDITQGFVKKINYKTNKRKIIPSENRITVEGTHNAIVDEKTFFEVLKKIQKKP
jgi:DNA invertase Pin-like site-specific DNA recombinase